MTIIFPGIKVIHHNMDGVNLPDDPSLPYTLEAILRLPELVRSEHLKVCGGIEHVILKSEMGDSLKRFIEHYHLRTHRRLIQLTVTGPNGVLEQLSISED